MLLWLSILYMVPVGCKRYTHQGRCHGFVRLETSHTLVPWGEARAKSDRTGQDCPSKPKSVVQIMWVKQQ